MRIDFGNFFAILSSIINAKEHFTSFHNVVWQVLYKW